ncbi:MAG: glycosyltransferase [Ignavibacteria bacterium]|nr:glycosyltransferase [Ignavibacteria bacterium]
MRLLQLSPQFPFPLTDGGKISIANMSKALVEQGCAVDVFCLTKQMPESELIIQFEAYTGADIQCIQHDTGNSFRAIMSSLFDGTNPLYVRKHRNKLFEQAIMQHLQQNTIDGIICDHSAMAEYGLQASRICGIPVIMRMHNIEHVIWQRYADRFHELDPRRLYIQSQAAKLKQKEIQFAASMNYCAMITSHDVDVLHSMERNINAIHIPVGVDTLTFYPKEQEKSIHNRLIHATTYDWIHNVEAVDWFITNVLPSINTSHGAELHLLGKHMPERYKNNSTAGLIGHGFVEDMNAMLNTASMYIAPLFVGAGVRIKILEAMATGLPVIASRISAEGIQANREDGLIICDDADQFIKEISGLIMNPEEANRLGGNARSFILEHHSWEKSAQQMITLFKTAVNM